MVTSVVVVSWDEPKAKMEALAAFGDEMLDGVELKEKEGTEDLVSDFIVVSGGEVGVVMADPNVKLGADVFESNFGTLSEGVNGAVVPNENVEIDAFEFDLDVSAPFCIDPNKRVEATEAFGSVLEVESDILASGAASKENAET